MLQDLSEDIRIHLLALNVCTNLYYLYKRHVIKSMLFILWGLWMSSICCMCTCVAWCTGVCVCGKRKCINWNLSTFLKLEICHPEDRSSVWFQLTRSDSLCQQYSSLFPECGFSHLDPLSYRRVKTQAALCWPCPLWGVFQVSFGC